MLIFGRTSLLHSTQQVLWSKWNYPLSLFFRDFAEGYFDEFWCFFFFEVISLQQSSTTSRDLKWREVANFLCQEQQAFFESLGVIKGMLDESNPSKSTRILDCHFFQDGSWPSGHETFCYGFWFFLETCTFATIASGFNLHPDLWFITLYIWLDWLIIWGDMWCPVSFWCFMFQVLFFMIFTTFFLFCFE